MLSYGFYNYVAGDEEPKEYDAMQFGQIFDGLIDDGIFATYGNKFNVVAGSTPGTVVVKSGRAWLLHTWNYNDADLDVDVLSPHGTYDRIDALVIDVDNESRTNQIMWVQGTPSSYPGYPELAGYNSVEGVEHKQFPLCYVKRHAGVSTVSPSDIENAIGVDHGENDTAKSTPFVVCPVDKALNVPQELMANWELEFWNYIEKSKTSFDAWFANMRGQLTEDAATHLQDEIDALNSFVEETVTLRNDADVEVAFHSSYVESSSFIQIGTELNADLPTPVYKAIIVNGDTVTVTFPRYIGEGVPPTFKARLYLR